MIMVNLAEVCNDKNSIAWEFSDKIKDFCKKYQISPQDIEVRLTLTGDIDIKVKV